MTLVATTATATATAATQRGQGTEVGDVAISLANPGKNRDGTFGGLFAVGTIGSQRAHRLELFKLVLAGWTQILIKRHVVTFLIVFA